MMDTQEYEAVRKEMMRLTTAVINSSKQSGITLEQKIPRIQAGKDLQKALDILRLNHFKIEDALK